MKIKLLIVIVIAIAITSPVHGTIREYSDEYVSFSYDDEMPGELYVSTSDYSSPSVHYYLHCINPEENEDEQITCFLTLIKKDENFDQDTYDTLLETGVSDHTIYQNDDNALCYLSTRIGSSDPAFIESLEVFRNSLIVQENIESVDVSKIKPRNLVLNVKLSDQALVYAQAALDILSGYMNMDIEPDEAAAQIEKLHDRIENYLDGNTCFYYDYKVEIPLSSMDFYIKFGHDDIVSETILELEELLSTGNSEN